MEGREAVNGILSNAERERLEFLVSEARERERDRLEEQQGCIRAAGLHQASKNTSFISFYLFHLLSSHFLSLSCLDVRRFIYRFSF